MDRVPPLFVPSSREGKCNSDEDRSRTPRRITKTPKTRSAVLCAAGSLAAAPLAFATAASAETITIATVNNADMIIMQKLSRKWEQQTGSTINWTVLEDNVLRQRVTTDIAARDPEGRRLGMVLGARPAVLDQDDGRRQGLRPLRDLEGRHQTRGRLPGLGGGVPGTRQSTYENLAYQKAAPFAKVSLDAILSADPAHPTAPPVPYTGVQFVAIPELQSIGTTVGQDAASTLAGSDSVDAALKSAQAATEGVMRKTSYGKK